MHADILNLKSLIFSVFFAAMAVYHHTSSIIGMSSGGSAVASAAYRHGAHMRSDTLGITKDYDEKAAEVVHSEVMLPEDAPEAVRSAFGEKAFEAALKANDGDVRKAWAEVSQKLWNDVEQNELRVNKRFAQAQFARSIEFALPHELGRDAQIELARGYMRETFTDKGMIADWVIHDKGDNKPHVHLMLTQRSLADDGWGLKNCAWNSKAEHMSWRVDWARHANHMLEREGHSARVDHRSNEARGIYLEPEGFSPWVAKHAEAAGDEPLEKLRSAEVAQANLKYLRRNPEHILFIVQSQQAVFTEEDVRKALIKRLPDVNEAEQLAARVMNSPDIIRIGAQPEQGDDALTLASSYATERRVVAGARNLHQSRLADMNSAGLQVGEGLSDLLNPGQKAAAEAMLSDTRLTLVKGHAGTGKTYTLSEVARVWGERGYQVLGGAISGKAVGEMDAVGGMQTATLAAYEARWARGKLPEQGKFVFLLDEAGMVGSAQWQRLQDRVTKLGGKLIAVGDPEQLQPIADVPAWQSVEREVADVHVLSQVMRQDNFAERSAVEALARGGDEIGPAIQYFCARDRLKVDAKTLRNPLEAVQGSWLELAQTGGETGYRSQIALAYSNREVAALNDALHGEAVKSQFVAPLSVRDYGVITRVFTQKDDAPTIEKVKLHLGEGDRVMLTRTHRELNIPRSSFGTVVGTRLDEIDLLVDGAKTPVTLDLNRFRDLDYGYASTIHKSQGMTVDHALVVGHKRMNRHAVYVALSRHRKSVQVFGRRRHLESGADLLELAQKPGHLDLGDEDARRVILEQSSSRSVAETGIAARADWLGGERRGKRVGVLSDASLMNTATRIAGLLASEWLGGGSVLKDPDGDGVVYVRNPQKVIDDLIKRSSVIRADQVADELAKEVAEPETFLRLFREAMAHPDLVAFEQEGQSGEGRLFTTTTQLSLETAAVDRGLRLGLSRAHGVADLTQDRLGRDVEKIGADRLLTDGQREALRYGGSAGSLRLIQGAAGSGKTTVIAALDALHQDAGWDVHVVSPTGAGLDGLRARGVSGGRTLRSFEAGLEEGRIKLGPRSVILLDDAGRVGGPVGARVLERVEASGAKLVAAMDTTQQSLDAGPVFRALELRLGSARIGDNLRQPEHHQGLVKDITQGGAAGRLRVQGLIGDGTVQDGGSLRAAPRVLAEGYLKDESEDKIVLALSRADVEAVTVAIRRAMDQAEPDRAAFVADADGAFKGVKPGDKLMFTAWGPLKDVDGGEVLMRAGHAAKVLGRGASGGMVLNVEIEGADKRIEIAPGSMVPDWRYGFANTVHGSLGRGHRSVHVLANPGMNRQVLGGAVSVYEEKLSIVVPSREGKAGEMLEGVLARDGAALSVFDYGFEPGLAARHAVLGQSKESEPVPNAAFETLRRVAGIAEDQNRRALPRGLEGEVLAEVVGASVLRRGEAPQGQSRLAVEGYVRALSAPSEWRRLLRQVPQDLPRKADDLARESAGVDGEGRLLTPARIMARGALVAEAMGEMQAGAAFRDGLELYGTRAAMARSVGQIDKMVAPRVAEQSVRVPEAVPTPASKVRAPKPKPRSGQGLKKVVRGLSRLPTSEAAAARYFLEGLPGLGRGSPIRYRPRPVNRRGEQRVDWALSAKSEITQGRWPVRGQRAALAPEAGNTLVAERPLEKAVENAVERPAVPPVVSAPEPPVIKAATVAPDVETPAVAPTPKVAEQQPAPEAAPPKEGVHVSAPAPVQATQTQAPEAVHVPEPRFETYTIREMVWEAESRPEEMKPEVHRARFKDYALGLAVHITNNVDPSSPVHQGDLPGMMASMFASAERDALAPNSVGPNSPVPDEKTMLRWVAAGVGKMSENDVPYLEAVNTALEFGLPPDGDKIEVFRGNMLKRLIDPKAEEIFPPESIEMAHKVFTREEFKSFTDKTVQWLPSLPEAGPGVREMLSKNTRAITAKYKEGLMRAFDANSMDQRTTQGRIRVILLNMLTNPDDPQMANTAQIEEFEHSFTKEEMASLRDPKAALAPTLPEFTQRGRYALARALGWKGEDPNGGSIGAASKQVPARWRDVSLQLACAVTQRVNSESPSHMSEDLQQDIALMLDRAERSGLPDTDDVRKAAKTLAQTRARMDTKIAVAVKYDEREIIPDEVRTTGAPDYIFVAAKKAYEVDWNKTKTLSSRLWEDAEPTEIETLVTKVAQGAPEGPDKHLAQEVSKALSLGSARPAEKIKAERRSVIELMSEPSTMNSRTVGYKLYKNFTHREVWDIANKGNPLPKDVQIVNADRDVIEKNIATTNLVVSTKSEWGHLFRTVLHNVHHRVNPKRYERAMQNTRARDLGIDR